jgi:hypothetical protein
MTIFYCNKIDYAILVKPFHNLPTRFPTKIKAFKNPPTAAKGRKLLALPGLTLTAASTFEQVSQNRPA